MKTYALAVLTMGGAEAFLGPAKLSSATQRSAQLNMANIGEVSELTWQQKARRLLRPDLSFDERQKLTKSILEQREDIRKAVEKTIEKRDLDVLLEGDTEGKEIREALKAVQRQLMDDIIPDVLDKLPEAPQKISDRLRESRSKPSLSSSQPKMPELTTKSMTKMMEEFRSEFGNVFEADPANLEKPDYEVVPIKTFLGAPEEDGEFKFELRRYGRYAKASTAMRLEDPSADVLDDVQANGDGFNTLARYIFGGNDDKTSISMTTPVEVTYTKSEGGAMDARMAFPLPQSKYVLSSDAPKPKNSDVVLEESAAGLVLAVMPFKGIATDGEVKRKLAELTDALDSAGIPIKSRGNYRVFQYNPPYTLPWIRKNELAVEITASAAMAASAITAVAAAAEDFAGVKEEEKKEKDAATAATASTDEVMEEDVEEASGAFSSTSSSSADKKADKKKDAKKGNKDKTDGL